MNRRYYVEFLDQCQTVANDDILKSNVFIVLLLSEIIALSRVYSIFSRCYLFTNEISGREYAQIC